MAKRSLDVSKWRDPDYRALPLHYKLLWDFIHCDCDNAGVWVVDMEIASINVTKRVKADEAVKLFGQRIHVFENGRKWFIYGFVDENAGCPIARLSWDNKYHKSILELIQKHGLPEGGPVVPKGHARGLEAPIYIEKAKEQAKAQEQGGPGGKEALSQEEIFTRSEEIFTRSFDERTMELYQIAYPTLHLDQELTDFKLKVRNAWKDYRDRDVGGIRTAFQFQLRQARDKAQRNNNGIVKSTNKKQQHTNDLVAAHARKYGSGTEHPSGAEGNIQVDDNPAAA